MAAATQVICFEGQLLQRGFWLYVWEVTTADGAVLLYVGRTGDSSSMNAQSPFVRMGQHVGYQQNSSMLRKYLEARNVDLEQCRFRQVAHGPIIEEAADIETHRERRDAIAAMEKRLAEDLVAAGYEVMNPVACRKTLDAQLYADVRAAFAAHFVRS